MKKININVFPLIGRPYLYTSSVAYTGSALSIAETQRRCNANDQIIIAFEHQSQVLARLS